MTIRSGSLIAASALGLTVCTGCPFADSRTTNQGGGTVVSAVDKIGSEQLASLTPDEVQILGDTFTAVQDQLDVFITDEQASDAVFFLIEHNLNTFEDLQRFILEAQQNPDAVQVPESLIQFAESLDLSKFDAAAGG